MTEFLDLVPLTEFWKILWENMELSPKQVETICYTECLHRVLARDIRSPENLPPFARSTVDGFAVRAMDVAGASESLPSYLIVRGEVLMGEATTLEVQPGEAIRISTGGMLPAGADAVLMVEYTEYLDSDTIECSTSVSVGENVVQKGEDIEEGALLLERGHVIRPQDIGALAGLGITQVDVYAKPVVAVISTGDELVAPAANPGPGEIRDINSYSIGALLAELGCQVRYIGIVKDSFTELKKAVEGNLDCNLILISGGSSVGIKDCTIDVLNSLGDPGVLVHGIAIKPGKPTILAGVKGVPVIGLPGHPASAWTVANQVVVPIVRSLKGEKPGRTKRSISAVLNRNVASARGREEYIPVRVSPSATIKDGVTHVAEPMLGKSSLITTFVQANAFLKIAADQEGLNEGDVVEVHLFGTEGDMG